MSGRNEKDEGKEGLRKRLGRGDGRVVENEVGVGIGTIETWRARSQRDTEKGLQRGGPEVPQVTGDSHSPFGEDLLEQTKHFRNVQLNIFEIQEMFVVLLLLQQIIDLEVHL